MVDGSTAVWITGTVLRYEPIHPHAMIYLEVATEDGRLQPWTVEGPRPMRVEGLGLAGDIVHAGDVITICGFYPIAATSTRRTKPRFVHGKILVTDDGQKWAWGPYGRLEHCVDESEWDSIARGSNPLRP